MHDLPPVYRYSLCVHEPTDVPIFTLNPEESEFHGRTGVAQSTKGSRMWQNGPKGIDFCEEREHVLNGRQKIQSREVTQVKKASESSAPTGR
uniref:Uncharacterized protein n=1 Tax=Caenorhabditis tropicalis TaxID=1561998 RepID=A0A1I7SXL9_9PELO